MTVTIGSLFSGIGGLERGLEAAIPGARVVWQAEKDQAATAVLARHYPMARRYTDVRDIDANAESVDIICGGFPCQDISDAGKRAGIDGDRSGLWREYARIVGVLRPGLVFVENVAALLGRGLDRVLGDLAARGYDAVWETFRASDVGAPHRRDRVFILAYAGREFLRLEPGRGCREDGACSSEPGDAGAALADADGIGRHARAGAPAGNQERSEHGNRRDATGVLADADRQCGDGREREPGWRSPGRASAAGHGQGGNGQGMADANGGRQWPSEQDVRTWESDPDRRREGVADAHRAGREGQIGREPSRARRGHATVCDQQALADADGIGREQQRGGGLLDGERSAQRDDAHGCDCPRCYVHRFPPGPDRIAEWDGPQPAIRRSDDGVPGRSHRLRLLGNAVVPQQATLAFLTLLRAARGA